MDSTPDTKRRMHALLACLAIVAAVAALYFRTKDHAFVSVDVAEYLTENPHLQQGLTLDGLRWAWTSSYASNWHPLTWMSHMLDVELFGMQPAGHNLENAAWHAGSSVLLFLVLLAWTSRLGPSLFVALCFAVHPQHVESVAWIAERKDVLSAFLGLASLLAWTGWARRRSRSAFAFALVLYALGLCAKPMLVTWPFAMLLFDVWPLRRTELGWKRLVVEKLPFLALAAASSWLTYHAQSSTRAMQSLADMPAAWRVPNAILSYGRYLAHTVWPVDLVVYYPHPGPTIEWSLVWASAALCVAILVVGWRLRASMPWILVGFLFYLGTLVPVIGLVQVGGQAMADRYSYLPLIGVFAAVAFTAPELARRWPPARPFVPMLATLLVLAQLVLASAQVNAWRNSRTLGEQAARVTPESSWGWNLIARSWMDEGNWSEAAKNLRRSVAAQPGDPLAWSMLGKALALNGDAKGAEEAYRNGLVARPDDPGAMNRLAELLLDDGRVAEAEGLIRRSLDLNPDLAGGRHVAGRFLEMRGDLAGAELEYERALDLLPSLHPARMKLARLLMRRGEYERALREIDVVLAALPLDFEARRGRARALGALGRDADAVKELERLVAENPGFVPARTDLAWVLASTEDAALRDVPRAITTAERALQLAQNRPPGVLDALALAYASAGRFDEAVAAARSAEQRALELGDRELARRIGLRAAAYAEKRVDRTIPR